tara:strand:+ start:5647 stop:6393 length:747 start_codon:yes stop_codon:yes gene_type:complete
MNIIVCISSVPDTTSKINFTNNNTEFDKNGVQFIINPYDEFGLTKAIKLKENHGGNITVITVGDLSVEPIIRKALAIGADNGVRINMNPDDGFSTAKEIANYLNDNPYDLIIAGRESIDYNGGVVPGMISELLNIPFINACIDLEISERNANLTREIDGGKEMISCSLPLIIGGQKGLVEESELMIPNMRGIMQSRTKPLNIIEPFENKKSNKTIRLEKPPVKSECKFIDGDNVRELIDLLQNDAKVI